MFEDIEQQDIKNSNRRYDNDEHLVVPGKALKKDLRVNIDYRAVNPFVWYLLYINYGGTNDATQVVQLPREAVDIYSKNM